MLKTCHLQILLDFVQLATIVLLVHTRLLKTWLNPGTTSQLLAEVVKPNVLLELTIPSTLKLGVLLAQPVITAQLLK